VWLKRLLERIGLGGDGPLLLLAVLIGLLAAGAAVALHEAVVFIRDAFFGSDPNAWLVLAVPAAAGATLGLMSWMTVRFARQPGSGGHGVVDVIESVITARKFVRPFSAVETTLRSAITIGMGGSAGVEGPIVHIGAALSSGVGRLFRIDRHQMPLLVGCGAAAGISAIFNAPLGGLLFVLEVILLDFSVRTITPLVLACVVANVATRIAFTWMSGAEAYTAIFGSTQIASVAPALLSGSEAMLFVALGVACGVVGVGLSRGVAVTETLASRMSWVALRPLSGGLLLGLLGAGWVLASPMFAAESIDGSLPPFYSDGYAFIDRLLDAQTYSDSSLLPVLAGLILVKLIASWLTLGSGMGGGVIAPSLALGATVGATTGVLGQTTHLFPELSPAIPALVGMGGVLAAVVHAPLAAIVILFELTQDWRITLPAMLVCVTSVTVARLIDRDSIYTRGLRRRGVIRRENVTHELARRSVSNVALEPATFIDGQRDIQTLIDLVDRTGHSTIVVGGPRGYVGMIYADELSQALRFREAEALLVVHELARTVPAVAVDQDLASVNELLQRLDVPALPVVLSSDPTRVIGLITRLKLLKPT
jgi:CIC family chloride channel protein